MSTVHQHGVDNINGDNNTLIIHWHGSTPARPRKPLSKLMVALLASICLCMLLTLVLDQAAYWSRVSTLAHLEASFLEQTQDAYGSVISSLAIISCFVYCNWRFLSQCKG